jgi:hypothetical protein
MIGNGYTYKNTADRLYRKMITSNQSNISLEESNGLKNQ